MAILVGGWVWSLALLSSGPGTSAEHYHSDETGGCVQAVLRSH